MDLTQEEYDEMRHIQNKMAKGEAKSQEIQRFLDLLIHSSDDNKAEIESYITNIGFKSFEDFKSHLNQRIENEETVKNLAVVGGGLLLAFLLSK